MTGSSACPAGVRRVEARAVLSLSRLPGIDRALNPYTGCSHACAYCYAQDVMRLGPRGEWGTWVDVKANAPRLLERELGKADFNGVVGVGTVTDPYQQEERNSNITRACLEVLQKHNAAVCIQTKSNLVPRDIDLIAGFARKEVGFTVTTLDEKLRRLIEPGAPPSEKRFEAMRTLSEAGIATWLFLGPVFPGLNDSNESVLAIAERAKESGARKILYDRYRPKPLADGRMHRALGDSFVRRGPMNWANILVGACRHMGMEAESAF